MLSMDLLSGALSPGHGLLYRLQSFNLTNLTLAPLMWVTKDVSLWRVFLGLLYNAFTPWLQTQVLHRCHKKRNKVVLASLLTLIWALYRCFSTARSNRYLTQLFCWIGESDDKILFLRAEAVAAPVRKK